MSREVLSEPQVSGAGWFEAMRRGDFARAWEISDAVLAARAGVPCHHLPRHEQYIWDGTPVDAKRVLVRCYHGLGDTVQFARFLPELRRRTRHVIVWAQPPLLPLLRAAYEIEFLPLHDGTPEVACDIDVELMELPHVLRTTLTTLPREVPYLFPPPAHRPAECDDARRSCHPLGYTGSGRRRVGVVWQSGGWDGRRSMPAAVLEPLTRVPGVELVALQLGDALADWQSAWGRVEATADPTELARRLVTLDLLLTVDSFPAHLAGALGVRTWTLLHSEPDWRWMLDREDSPWYPTMRLWRQRQAGDWEDVVRRVAAALEMNVRTKGGY